MSTTILLANAGVVVPYISQIAECLCGQWRGPPRTVGTHDRQTS